MLPGSGRATMPHCRGARATHVRVLRCYRDGTPARYPAQKIKLREADNPAVWRPGCHPPARRSPTPLRGGHNMLRLQAPLPDDYTLASPDELVARIARGQSGARRPAPDPRPPLPARRGHPLGRRRRRLVQARPLRGGQPPGHRHRVLRCALHGRVGRRAHRRPPARDPPRPQRRLLDGRHGRHRPGRGGVGGDRGGHRDRPRRADHLHELRRGAEGVRRPARRRGVHVVERASRARRGRSSAATRCCSSPTSTSAATPASTWATAKPTCACGTRATSCGGLEEREVKDSTLLLWKGHCSVHQRFRPEHVGRGPRRASRRAR